MHNFITQECTFYPTPLPLVSISSLTKSLSRDHWYKTDINSGLRGTRALVSIRFSPGAQLHGYLDRQEEGCLFEMGRPQLPPESFPGSQQWRWSNSPFCSCWASSEDALACLKRRWKVETRGLTWMQSRGMVLLPKESSCAPPPGKHGRMR